MRSESGNVANKASWPKRLVKKWLNTETSSIKELYSDCNTTSNRIGWFGSSNLQPHEASHSEKKLRMFVGTWNVGGRVPNGALDLHKWLISSGSSPADIYVLGSVPEELISVDVHAAYDLINTGKHRYLDVRTVEEFSKGHPVEDAINVPYMLFTPEGRTKNPKFLDEVASVLNKDEHIVVECQSGVRSLHAAVDLLDTILPSPVTQHGSYDT